MPELPEVETIVRGLNEHLPGRVVRSVEILWPGAIATPADIGQFAREVAGKRITRVGRRGKFIIIDLHPELYLLVHLRMSGRLYIVPANEPPTPHVRAIFLLDKERALHFSNMRKFGRLYLTNEPASILGQLGPEPLGDDFTLEQFSEMLSRRHARIKPLLLNQHFLAGLGNIYTDEALFRSGIHPLRPADTLRMDEREALYNAIRLVLRDAIAHHGTTLSEYRDVEGREGENQRFLQVYGRTGEPCLRCGQSICKVVVGQRGTHFCPHCQPMIL